MKIKSYIGKIIALAFVVLSLSFIFPAGSYAADAAICDDSIRINEKYILTNVYPKENAKVLSKYKPESGFSGVYNIDTKQWMALPSGEASLVEKDKNALPSEGASLEKDNNNDEFCTVEPQGGHLKVQKRFNEIISDNKLPHQNLGFFIKLNPDKEKTFNIRFISGKINCCYNKNRSEFPSREVPEKYQDAIKEAIETTMAGYKVEKDEKYRPNTIYCKLDDLNTCDN